MFANSGQVDNDTLVEVVTEDYRQQYGDGNDNGLRRGAPPGIIDDSHLLVAREEDTRDVTRMTHRETKTNGMGAFWSRFSERGE